MHVSNKELEELLIKIKSKIGWENPNKWSNYDFKKLSELIFEKTSTRMSTTTLKRVFGTVKYDSSPSHQTLNTLAQFIDFHDWRSFQNRTSKSESQTAQIIKQKNWKQILKFLIPIAFAILILFWIVVQLFLNKKNTINGKDYSLSYSKVGEEIPSSVIFKYNARLAPKNSVVQFQQSWDSQKRKLLKSTDSIHTSIYYYPGFFEAKLVVDNHVVSEKDVFIPSINWITTIEQDKTPIYVPFSESKKDGVIGIEPNFLSSQGFFSQRDEIWTNYNLVDKFDLYSDQFSLDVSLKNAAMGGPNICQNIEIIILLEGDAIVIPLAKPGCIADMNIFIPGLNISSETEDLTSLGIENSDWINLKVVSKENLLSIYLNDNLSKEYQFDAQARRLVGYRFRFKGSGWLKDLSLK